MGVDKEIAGVLQCLSTGEIVLLTSGTWLELNMFFWDSETGSLVLYEDTPNFEIMSMIGNAPLKNF